MSDSKSSPKVDKRPKTGGRKKGTPNKKTVWLRETFESGDIDFEGALRCALAEKNIGMIQALQGFLPYLSPRVKDKDADIDASNQDADPMTSLPAAELAAIARSIQ